MMVAGLPNNQIHKSDIADEFYQRRAYRNHLKMSFVSENNVVKIVATKTRWTEVSSSTGTLFPLSGYFPKFDLSK